MILGRLQSGWCGLKPVMGNTSRRQVHAGVICWQFPANMKVWIYENPVKLLATLSRQPAGDSRQGLKSRGRGGGGFRQGRVGRVAQLPAGGQPARHK